MNITRINWIIILYQFQKKRNPMPSSNCSQIWYLLLVSECLSISKWFKRALIWSWWAVELAASKKAQWWWFSKLTSPIEIIIEWVGLKKTVHKTVDASSKSGIHLLNLREEAATDATVRLSHHLISQMSVVNLLSLSLPLIVERQTKALLLVLMKRILPQMAVTLMELTEVLHCKRNSKILKLVNSSKLG